MKKKGEEIMLYPNNLKIVMKLFKSIILLLLLFNINVYSQSKSNKGSIGGKVIDETTGEPIIGANIILLNTNYGAASDIDGNYLITNLEPGEYELLISYISYAKTRITNVKVVAGQKTIINVALKPEAIKVDEITITGKLELSYEAALLNKQKNSISISDGISAEQIKKSPDATSSDALRRITGVSIVDNKFVFVRGTSERYSNAMLNSASLSSTEPDKKSFAFDIIPANLLDNTIIEKTYTPDKPGNFAGGLVNLNTIDFPDNLKFNVSLTGSYNNVTFSDFKTYKGGKLDFLGIDDGTRALPSVIPSDLSKGNYSQSQILEFAKSLPNNWAIKESKAPLNGGFMVSLGDGISVFGPRFGFITALTYRNSFNKTFLERNEYEFSGEPRFSYTGDQFTYTTLWGGLLNLSYKISDYHKFSLKNTYSHSSDDEVSQLRGAQYSDAGNEQILTSFRFTSRQVYMGQLTGEHFFSSLNNLQIGWKAFNSISKRNEPDYRRVIYFRELGSTNQFTALLGPQVNLKNGGRFYSNLDEVTRGFNIDFSLPIVSAKLKFGTSLEHKNRDFNSRLIGTIINAPGNGFTDFNLLYLPIDKIFSPENFRKNGFSIQEYLNGTNNYKAEQDYLASYLMIEESLSLLNKELKIILGARIENSSQRIKSRDISDQQDLFIELKKTDLLPSINLIYKVSEATNIRLSANQTVNRPELRELAPFAYYDFYTQTSLRGNPDLRRALIRNYDLRFESYPGVGELFSLGFFYKDIKDAIEQVVVTGSALGSERTFMNADIAKVYGIEFENRVNLSRLSNLLSNFSINSNLTLIKSSVTVKGTESTIAREGRPLQGQSPYVINVGITYNAQNTGTTFSILYNRIGERIVEVATTYEDDIVEKPRDVIDIVINHQLTKNIELKLTAKDILGQDKVFMQGNKRARLDSTNSSVSLNISYKL
ncbi:MAG: carboxypeptidase-like regulatory domain-containing protein [Melioribacter sp.]|nr:carboxypeptidase-like regulatory domain-containing protein [Melioribacter sp.]